MRVFDISVPLTAGLATWEDEEGPVLETLCDLASGDRFTLTCFSMGSHAGTHVDAPAHYIAGDAGVESLPLEALVGPALVVEHRGATHVTARDLATLGVDGSHSRVLIKTANGRLWEDTRFHTDFIALTADAARYVVERGLQLIGIDYLSIAPYDDPDEVHQVLLGAGLVALEGVDLREVPVGEYFLVCAPLRLVGAEGAPARVFLIADM